MAIKIARSYTNRKKIIGFQGLYHGQLFASLALGASASQREKLTPLVPDITPMGFPRDTIGEEGFASFITELEALLSKEDVAAVVTEPGIITGAGSTFVAYPGFLTMVRELTQKYGTLLIVDEVGSGFSRTGTLFGIEHENVVPDMVALAKGISNGAAAIGATVGKTEIFEAAFDDAILISTFGWTPIACAAALKTLQVHQRDKTHEMSEKKGAYIKDTLKPFLGGTIVDIRGMGMEIGVQLKDTEEAKRVQKAAFADGLHVVVGSGDNLQIMPPLTISQELLEKGLDILSRHI